MFLEQDEEKIGDIMPKLALASFIPSDFVFLKDYLALTCPIAVALDCLQGEANCFLGCVLSVLVKTKNKLKNLTLSHSAPVRDILFEKLDTRFGHLFHDDLFIIAASVHPAFKLHWIEDPKLKDIVKSKLNGLIGELSVANATSVLPSPVASATFLDFDAPTIHISSELETFLSDGRKHLNMLDSYPNIYKLFVQINTPLPSSAPVERLFSIAALILTARRANLSDLLFEHLLLLKIMRKL